MKTFLISVTISSCSRVRLSRWSGMVECLRGDIYVKRKRDREKKIRSSVHMIYICGWGSRFGLEF